MSHWISLLERTWNDLTHFSWMAHIRFIEDIHVFLTLINPGGRGQDIPNQVTSPLLCCLLTSLSISCPFELVGGFRHKPTVPPKWQEPNVKPFSLDDPLKAPFFWLEVRRWVGLTAQLSLKKPSLVTYSEPLYTQCVSLKSCLTCFLCKFLV